MALNSGDLSLRLILPPGKSSLRGVVGKELTFTLRLNNNSTTDPIYNVSVALNLPDGISYVNSTLSPATNTIDEKFNNTITFVNVTDLYPSSNNFDIDITLTVDPYYRSNGSEVAYGSSLSGLSLSATGDSTPRGFYDEGNVVVESVETTSITALRYSITLTGPEKYIMGAGTTPGPSSDATSIFEMGLNILNSTRDESIVSFDLDLANGIRYLGDWTATGTDFSNFSSPVVTSVGEGQDFVSLGVNNKILSEGSETSISFQAAIWDRYTVDGVENSGDIIDEETALVSTALMTGNRTSYSTSHEILAVSLLIDHYCTTTITDAGSLKDYVLSYSTTGYNTLSDLSLSFIIPDGMSYVEGSSSLPPDSITSVGNTTVLNFELDNTEADTIGEIRLSLLTNDTYSDSSPVYSTDEFTTYFNAEYTSPSQGELIEDTTEFTITVEAPTITNEVVGYFYSDGTQKEFDTATVGDYVRFSITYDATNISAPQRDLTLYDYPPFNINTTGVTNIEATGDFPEDASYFPMPNNGARIPVGTMAGGSFFTLAFDLPVDEEVSNDLIYNLAKAVIINTDDITHAVRDSAIVFFGTPNLRITHELIPSTTIALGDNVTYRVTVENTTADGTDYIADAFNVDFKSSIDPIYTLRSKPVVSGDGSYGDLEVSGNDYNMDILKLGPNESITITSDLTVSSLPISGEDYNIYSAISNATSQEDATSYRYTTNRYPLNVTLATTGATPEITKVYTPSTVKLYEEYDATVTVDIPAGVLMYNTKIKDSLVTTDSSNFRNPTLNGEPVKVDISTNNLTLPLDDVLDTSKGPVTYVFNYTDTVLTASPVNYEQDRITTASFDWSDEASIAETHSVATTATLKVVFPGLDISKEQSNITNSFPYDDGPISGQYGDIINYRITVRNAGKSPAYEVVISDVIPETLNYLRNSIGGSYDSETRILTVQLEEPIEAGESIEAIIQASIIDDSDFLVAENSAAVSYTPNDVPEAPEYNSRSNVTSIYSSNNSTLARKLQQNVTSSEDFTTSTIRAFTDQSIRYRTVITNPYNRAIENISIEDVFPAQFAFIEFDPFTAGKLDVNGNTVTANVDTLAPGESIEYSYTIQLEENTLSLESSRSVMTYSLEGSDLRYLANSNILYVKLSDLGKGFSFY